MQRAIQDHQQAAYLVPSHHAYAADLMEASHKLEEWARPHPDHTADHVKIVEWVQDQVKTEISRLKKFDDDGPRQHVEWLGLDVEEVEEAHYASRAMGRFLEANKDSFTNKELEDLKKRLQRARKSVSDSIKRKEQRAAVK
eukprot:scaffold229692_cov26-Tisochrysis_lutea.AAC.1